MSPRPEAPRRTAPDPSGELIAFVALAYLLSWAWLLPVAINGREVVAGLGWPTHLPALLGPMAAALLVVGRTQGRAGVVDLLHRMASVRRPLRWWAVALSPVLLLLAVAVAAVMGWTSVDPAGLAQFPGVPSGWGAAGVVATVVLVNGFGEETGWRGYAQPLLQRRHGPLVATLGVSAIWGVWHLPMFVVLASFRSFGPATLVGWTIGLFSGAVVLAWLYNRSGDSILLAAVWHGGFNLVSATAVGAGFLGAAATALVIVAATALVLTELVRTRSGHPSILLPDEGISPAGHLSAPRSSRVS
jgi:membrane protease YdiL (CAAX protease family)